jgi:hypothetical protein
MHPDEVRALEKLTDKVIAKYKEWRKKKIQKENEKILKRIP